jgi:hypothetical protein
MRAQSMAWTLVATLLTGCAANVTRGSGSAAPTVRVPPESAAKITMNVTGPRTLTQSQDWELFKGEWRAAMKSQALSAGLAFDTQEGEPKPTGEAGTLLVVHVNDYRYLSPGARFGFGVMTGNAYIDAKIRFADLKNGKPFGEQSYNTSSSAWQGIFSAMTEKQVQAIAAEIVREVRTR